MGKKWDEAKAPNKVSKCEMRTNIKASEVNGWLKFISFMLISLSHNTELLSNSNEGALLHKEFSFWGWKGGWISDICLSDFLNCSQWQKKWFLLRCNIYSPSFLSLLSFDISYLVSSTFFEIFLGFFLQSKRNFQKVLYSTE